MLALLAKYKLMVFAVALLGALGLGGAGVAAANGGAPLALNVLGAHFGSGSTSLGAAQGKRNPARGVTHGSVITKVNGAYVTYTVDVGRVSAISSTAITLTELDTRQVTLSVSANTVWGGRHTAPTNLSKLHGRRIIVFSQNGVAIQIGRGDGLLKNAVHLDVTVIRNGKTREIQIDRGSVQSVSATRISVKRADGVTVTEPVAAKARWIQAPHHTAIQPSQVAVGASVAIVTYQGNVVVVRLPAAS
ncbi:MAG TPA: hypothetical protein VE338_16345 [Ktedonobacterales bacterium]|jgi:hypothetical protein|nr:hypothetical protein [Ktedonobacterales bacterium]